MTERICEGCGFPIIRNLAMYDQGLYHYGCLKRTHGKPDYQCLDCLAYWSRGRLARIEYADDEPDFCCPECGCGDLRHLRSDAPSWEW